MVYVLYAMYFMQLLHCLASNGIEFLKIVCIKCSFGCLPVQMLA